MDSWFKLTISVPDSLAEPASDLMFSLGSSGLEFDETGAEHRITAYFPEQAGRESVQSALSEFLEQSGEGSLDLEDVPNEDWGAKWRDHFEPIWPTPRMVVHPPWNAVEPPADGFSIAIEPKTAFGTGSHPTTKMALIALERVMVAGDRVLDVGAGSGVLSIAAAKLGASEVIAIDTDPLSTENVLENVGLNSTQGISVYTRGMESSDKGFNVAVANIISSVLTPLLPALRESVAPAGHVILGGILDREEGQFTKSVVSAGLEVLEITKEAEWIGLITKVSP